MQIVAKSSAIVTNPAANAIVLRVAAASGLAISGSAVRDSASIGTVVGTMSAATVPAGEGALAWSLAENARGRYAIDAASGAVTVAGALAAGTDAIVVKATMGGLAPALAAIAITVAIDAAVPVITVRTVRQLYPDDGGFAYPATCVICEPIVQGGYGPYVWALTSNPGGLFAIAPASGIVSTPYGMTCTAGMDYPLTLCVTDALGASAEIDILAHALAGDGMHISTGDPPHGYSNFEVIWRNQLMSPGYYAPGYTAATLWVRAAGASSFTFALSDPSGCFALSGAQAKGVNVGFVALTVPPIGVYPLTITATDAADPSHVIVKSMTVHVQNADAIGNILFAPAAVNDQWQVGMEVGTARAAGDEDNVYRWTLVDSASGLFSIDENTGRVVLTRQPAAGSHAIVAQVADGTNAYAQGFTIAVAAGTAADPGALTFDALRSDLNNYSVKIGDPPLALGAPVVAGMAAGGTWHLWGSAGVRARYVIDPATGAVSAVAPLSFQPGAGDLHAGSPDFTDRIILTYAAGSAVVTRAFLIPVAAISGPALSVGPGLDYAAVDGNGRPVSFASLGAAVSELIARGWPGGAVITVYPSDDRTYYANDGMPASGRGFYPGPAAPLTVQGAAGQPMPFFSGNNSSVGNGGNGIALFAAGGYDLTLRGLEIAGTCGGNMTAVALHGSSGNVFLDNCFIHDSDDGIARGHDQTSSTFVTNTRLSQCGIGQGFAGRDHNTYVLADTFYCYNVLTDGAAIGHDLKTRSNSTWFVNGRSFDGAYGYASCQYDNFQGGVVTIRNSVLHKGANPCNPNMVQFAGSGDALSAIFANRSNPTNTLDFEGNTLICWPSLTDSNATVAAGVVCGGLAGGFDGQAPIVTAGDNAFYGLAPGRLVRSYSDTTPTWMLNTVGAGNAIGAGVPPELDWTFPGPGPDPTLAFPLPPLISAHDGWYGSQIVPPLDEFRVPASAPIGTRIARMVWVPSSGGDGVVTGTVAPVWSLGARSSARYAIDASTGVVTTTDALASGTVDTIEVLASVAGSSFSPAGLYWVAGDYPYPGKAYHGICIGAVPAGQIALFPPQSDAIVPPGQTGASVPLIAKLSGYGTAPILSVSTDGGATWATLAGTITATDATFTLSLSGGWRRVLMKDGAGVVSNPIVVPVHSATLSNLPTAGTHGAAIVVKAGRHLLFNGVRQVYVAMHAEGADGVRAAMNATSIPAVSLTPAAGACTVRVYDDFFAGNMLAESATITIT